jgi:hypothetical protein
VKGAHGFTKLAERYDGYIMMSRTQILLEQETQRRARRRAFTRQSSFVDLASVPDSRHLHQQFGVVDGVHHAVVTALDVNATS